MLGWGFPTSSCPNTCERGNQECMLSLLTVIASLQTFFNFFQTDTIYIQITYTAFNLDPKSGLCLSKYEISNQCQCRLISWCLIACIIMMICLQIKDKYVHVSAFSLYPIEMKYIKITIHKIQYKVHCRGPISVWSSVSKQTHALWNKLHKFFITHFKWWIIIRSNTRERCYYKLEYWMDNWTVSDVTGHSGIIGQYLANAIISDKSKWR